MKADKNRKKISQHLLHFAENDKFRPVLHLLLSPSSAVTVNLNARTSSGDYLINLLAYFVCELGGSRNERLLALKCLKLVLERDFSAVNKVGGDGSSALHCALAAASGEEECEFPGRDEEESDDDQDDDSDYGDSDSDDEDANIDQSFLAEIEELALGDSQMDSYCAEFDSLTTYEITLASIYMLLHNGADPNIPLANVNGIRAASDEGNHGDDEDEIELTFSREAIVQQWTALMFVIQWIIITAIKILTSNGNVEKGKGGNAEQVLALPYAVLELLLDFDADRTYMMAGDVSCDWNLAQVVASASHLLSKVSLVQSELSNVADQMRLNCASIISIADKFESPERNVMTLSSLYDILLDRATTDDVVLSDIQSFAAALVMDDFSACSSIIHTHSESDDLQHWTNSLFEGIFPTLQLVWGNSLLSAKSLFDVACSCCAIDSLGVILAEGFVLSETQIRSAIISTFEDFAGRALSKRDATVDERLVEKQTATIVLLLDNSLKGNKGLRQRMLDRLLLESCSGKMWTIYSPYATKVFLNLGADPNVESISDEIQNSLKPLHLVAGNCRGRIGLEKLQWLLLHNGSSRRADLLAVTASQGIPIHIALQKENFLVAEKLLEAMGEDWIDLNWNTKSAILICEVSIHCANVSLFKRAVNLLISTAPNEKKVLEKAIGGFLVSICDERSSFGKLRPISVSIENIKAAVCFVDDKQLELGLINLASWARDEISGNNIVHLILRGDRGEDFRSELLSGVCKLITGSTNSTSIISQHCAAKFGGYTPLHLAASLGCEESISTLLDFNADAGALDEEQKSPLDLIPGNRICLVAQNVQDRLLVTKREE